jgi:anti-sigma regulatory factor (Ser/Thr protein kinase)
MVETNDDAPLVQLKVALPARPEGLEDLHTAFDQFFAEAEVPLDDQIALLTAAGEVAANIMEHACRDLPDAEMLLELYGRHGGFEVAFTDPGTEFETDSLHGDTVDSGSEGGRGLQLVRASVDEVEYQRKEDTNRWRLLRTRRPSKPPEAD